MVSESNAIKILSYTRVVLILVLMEYGLGVDSHIEEWKAEIVLILVLMEYGLGEPKP